MIELIPIIPGIKGLVDPRHFISFMDTLMTDAVNRMGNKLKTYPPYKYVSWKSIGGFVSERQRKHVMANIRTGVIQIPHPRTKSLEMSWTLQTQHTSDALTYIYGTNHPKARYIQSKKTQHKRMTKIGWQTVTDVTTNEWPKERRKIEQAVARYKPPPGR